MSRTVYLGTSPFAATVLRVLSASAHRPRLVVTQPKRGRGRGRKELPTPTAEAAAEIGIQVLETEAASTGEALERIRELAPEVGVVCAFGQIIRAPLLDEVELLNVHPSLLPRWRGAAPIERTLMAGDDMTGVCVMRLTEGLDEGPVALREEAPVAPDEDFGSLSERLASDGGRLLVRALDERGRGGLAFAEQDGEATYAEKIERGERLLDPARPALELERTVRALTPHIGAQLELEGGERLGVVRAVAADQGLPRGVLEGTEDALVLGCGDGALRIEILKPPGGRAMPAADFLRGHEVPVLPSA